MVIESRKVRKVNLNFQKFPGKGAALDIWCFCLVGIGVGDAEKLSKMIFEAVLADVGLDMVFVTEDGAIAGGKIDVKEFLDFPNVVRFKTPTADIALDCVGGGRRVGVWLRRYASE